MKKTIAFALLLALIPALALFGQDAKQNSIAVVDFDNKGVEQNIPPTVTEIFNTEIFRAGKFNIIERNQVKKILDEQKFQISGLSDNEFTKLGKMLGAKFILVGSVGLLGKKYIINSRILDVESATIVMAESGSTFTVEDIEGVSQNIARKMVIQLNQRLNPNAPKTPVVQDQPQPEQPAQPFTGQYHHFIAFEGSLAPLNGIYWTAGGSYHYAFNQNFQLGLIFSSATWGTTGFESYTVNIYRIMPSAIYQIPLGAMFIQFGLAAGGLLGVNQVVIGSWNNNGKPVSSPFGICADARVGLGFQFGFFFFSLNGAFEGGAEFIDGVRWFGGPTGWLSVGFAL